MNLKEFLRGTKLVLDEGKWGAGHIPRSAFPLSGLSNKRYKYGPEYKWRVVRFECVAEVCRVLILLNEDKQIYRATLGIEDGGDLRVLCQHEYHASEPGWHCHFKTADHKNVDPGYVRKNSRRWPSVRGQHSKMEFNVSQSSAITKAADRFGFRVQGDLL